VTKNGDFHQVLQRSRFLISLCYLSIVILTIFVRFCKAPKAFNGAEARRALRFLFLFPDRGSQSGKEPCPAGSGN